MWLDTKLCSKRLNLFLLLKQPRRRRERVIRIWLSVPESDLYWTKKLPPAFLVPSFHVLLRLAWSTFMISTITQEDGQYSRYEGYSKLQICFFHASCTYRIYPQSFNYQVDRIFDSQTTTEEIYQDLVEDLVPFAWNGGIGTLFAYGQTGSGKTYTVSRLEQLVAESLMSGSFEGERQVYITIIDLAGNSAYDLLNSRAPISILEDAFGATQLAGAEEYQVQGRDEMIDLVERAASFRRTAPTLKNDASSRSHGICRIRVANPSTGNDGLLYLVDLAGSEAARDVAVHGADRMRETREINMSLSVLKDCIRGKTQADALMFSDGAKSKQKKAHVPFRQSALTKVLKHVFDPASTSACKTVVIACVNPSLADVGPSKNTLRYAEMLRVLVPMSKSAVYNPVAPMTWSNAQLREWISKNVSLLMCLYFRC
ncbi:hypothetical protein ACMFMF_003755 [Clarireedia jacksonii]